MRLSMIGSCRLLKNLSSVGARGADSEVSRNNLLSEYAALRPSFESSLFFTDIDLKSMMSQNLQSLFRYQQWLLEL
jgi:hypothetical protein